MTGNRREPEGIRRKKKRPPQTLEEIERINRITHSTGNDGYKERSRRKRPTGDDGYRERSRRKRPTEDESYRERSRRKRPIEDDGYSERSRKRRPTEDDGYKDSKQRNNLKKKKKKKSIGKIIRRVILVSIILLIAIVGFGIMNFISFFSNIDNSDTIASTPPTGSTINVLILGMDIGDTEQVGNDNIKRTDSMMLLNYNKETKKAQLVSIPRDTLINENGQNYKINAAFPKGGDKKVKSVVENILGINVNYIVKIKYEAFRSFIDAIGGIEMKIERDMIYDDDGQNLHINFKEGTTELLNGQKAEEFFRWRKNNDGTGFATGDIGRIENQHKFLSKVVDKCKSPSIIPKVPEISKSIAENIQTNMTSKEMIPLGLRLATSKAIQMSTVQGTPQMISGQSYLVVDKDANRELFNSLHTGKISDTSKKKELKILLLNGTKINGLASNVKNLMEIAGWNTDNIATDNTDLTNKSKILSNDKTVKEIINTDLPQVSKIEAKPDDAKYEGYDAIIIIGSDYKKLGE